MAGPTPKAAALLDLFDRPTEPLFMVKGENTWFEAPSNYLVGRYEKKPEFSQAPLAPVHVGAQFIGTTPQPFAPPTSIIKHVQIKKLAQLPDLTVALQIGRRDNFSVFLPSHRECSASLIKLFMESETIDDLLSNAAYCRDRVNPYLFHYALSLTILHREDTKHLQIPSLYEYFPSKFLDSNVLAKAKEEAAIPEILREPIDLDKAPYVTASEMKREHRLAYFREDLGVNLHHWHWHLAYPHSSPDPKMVDKDRRGELFYYMHQQMLARYDAERLCNKLNFVRRLINWKEELLEGYYPKLDSVVAGSTWPARCDNCTLKDLDRSDFEIDIDTLARWRSRIYGAVHRGVVFDEHGNKIPLKETDGIDILGNIVESSDLSKNTNIYGDLHNTGHGLISFCHDPLEENLESFAVMGDIAVAMRDPIFYRWHSFIDDIFNEHKRLLPNYKEDQLSFPDAKIISVQIKSSSNKINQLTTFWQKSIINLERGLDFSPRGPVCVAVRHLQHETFTYQIKVETKKSIKCTVRIFLAPLNDDRNNEMLYNDQRRKFIEMDRFPYTIKEPGQIIERESVKSSVTIPTEQIFTNVDDKTEKVRYCGCGWPHYLLVPKGTEEGFPFVLFVMLTDLEQDYVPPTGENVESLPDCKEAFTLCGLRNKKYPDKRAMGFPFDREASSQLIHKLSDFMEPYPNMMSTNITIVHHNKLEVDDTTKCL